MGKVVKRFRLPYSDYSKASFDWTEMPLLRDEATAAYFSGRRCAAYMVEVFEDGTIEHQRTLMPNFDPHLATGTPPRVAHIHLGVTLEVDGYLVLTSGSDGFLAMRALDWVRHYEDTLNCPPWIASEYFIVLGDGEKEPVCRRCDNGAVVPTPDLIIRKCYEKMIAQARAGQLMDFNVGEGAERPHEYDLNPDLLK